MTEQIPTGQNQQQTPPPSATPQGTSGLAIAGLVLGVVAVITSFVPIVNNASFFVAIVGLILAVVGRSQVKKGAKGGGGIAVAGIVLCVVAIVVTLAVQAACSAALDSLSTGSTGTVASSSAPAASDEAGDGGAAEQADTANMAVGQTVDLDNGLSITVNSVTPGLANYDGSTVAGVSITYTNNGTSNASFNVFDWKAEDANGAQRDFTYYSEAADELGSGTLSAGGSATGNIYFDEPIVKVYYYSSIIDSSSNIAWAVA